MKKTYNENTESKTENTESKTENTEIGSENTPDGDAPATGGLDAIAESLVGEMPDVQQHAIDEHESKERAKSEAYSELVDKNGDSFDPAKHKVDKHGNPTLSTLGKLILKPGRKPNADKKPRSVIGSAPDAKEQENATTIQERQQARAGGAMAANLIMSMGVALGGEEWKPVKDSQTGQDEKLMLESAFADYFEATGKTDIPPGFVLTFAISSYALPRLTMPKTRERGKRFTRWIKQKWIDRKLKKHGLKSEPTKNEKAEEKLAA